MSSWNSFFIEFALINPVRKALRLNLENYSNRVAGLVYSGGCYLVFFATLVYLIGFVGSLSVPKNINDGPVLDWPLAVLINTSLIALFSIQHTAMARSAFKARLTTLIPAAAERSTYVLLSSLVLTLLFWSWHPITFTLWNVETTWAKAVLTGLFWLGWGIAGLATLLISHFELFGLKQAIDGWRNSAPQTPVFRTPLLYKLVRHPLYLGFLIAFWATPHMTAGHLLFAAGMSVYIFIGAYFEEKDLVKLFGERYRRYQAEVGMILPAPKKRAAKPK
jgi:protein-S-isoprenylcysteine O-methyltransferase Ste14